MKNRFLISMVVAFMSIPFTMPDVFAHGVHSGIFGCPVDACGITDWHAVRDVSNTMFGMSLIVYVTISILFGFFLLQRKIILRELKNEN